MKETSWHAQLFVRAYTTDNAWIHEPNGCWGYTHLSAVKSLETFFTKHRETGSIWFSENEGKALDQLRKEADQARKDYFERLKPRACRFNATRVRRKMKEGRISICPYFWSVVLALLAYAAGYFPKMPEQQFKPVKWAKTLVLTLWVACFAFLTLAMVVMLCYVGFGVVRSIPHEIDQWKQNREWSRKMELVHQQELVAEKQREEEDLRNKLKWEMAHPIEAARIKAVEIAEAKEKREKQHKENMEALTMLGALVGSVLVLLAILWSIGWFLEKPFTRFMERVEAKLVTMWRSTRLFAFLMSVEKAWIKFWGDTWDLVLSFAKAKKEKICPFIKFEK